MNQQNNRGPERRQGGLPPRLEKVYKFSKDKADQAVQSVGSAVLDIQARRDAAQRARAEALANSQRLVEEQRLQELTRARNEIARLVRIGQQKGENDPAWNAASKVIDRVSGGDPRVALQLAELLRSNSRTYNDMLLRAQQNAADQAETAAHTRQELMHRPLRMGGGPGGVLAGMLSGDVSSASDRMTLDGNELIVRSPKSPRGRLHVDPRDIHRGDIFMTPDWPKWADDFLANVGSVIESDRVINFLENLIPWGIVEVGGKGRGVPFARVPSFFPGRRINRMMEQINNLEQPNFDLPPFQPEPDHADLLGRFSQSEGITSPVRPASNFRSRLLGRLRRR